MKDGFGRCGAVMDAESRLALSDGSTITRLPTWIFQLFKHTVRLEACIVVSLL